MSINKVVISGNLTRDPDLRATPSGMPILSFSVAVNDRVKNANSEWSDRANYIDCVLFGQRANSLSRYLFKGSKVAIEGKLRWSQWQDQQTGKNRSKIEVIVDNVDLMSQRAQQTPQQMSPVPQQAPVQQAPQQMAPAPRQPAPQPMQAQPAPQQAQQPIQSQTAPQQAPQQQQMAGMPAPQQTAPSIYDGDIPF